MCRIIRNIFTKPSFLNAINKEDHVAGKTFIALRIAGFFIVVAAIIGVLVARKSCHKSYHAISSVKTAVDKPPNPSYKANIDADNMTFWESDYIFPILEENMDVWSNTEYLIPSLRGDFFVPTRAVATKVESLDWKFSDISCNPVDKENCTINSKTASDGWVFTGECERNYYFTNDTYWCKMNKWLPIDDKNRDTVTEDIKYLTIFIRNTIQFPDFSSDRDLSNYMKDDTKTTELPHCEYDKEHNPFCPRFNIEYTLNAARLNYDSIAANGCAIRIYIKWECDLDNDKKDSCVPTYSFTRLDNNDTQSFDHGWYIEKQEYDEYYQHVRISIKLHGIHYQVVVDGRGWSFNALECLENIGSFLSYFGFLSFAVTVYLCITRRDDDGTQTLEESGELMTKNIPAEV